jgi:hypothetical protein
MDRDRLEQLITALEEAQSTLSAYFQTLLREAASVDGSEGEGLDPAWLDVYNGLKDARDAAEERVVRHLHGGDA